MVDLYDSSFLNEELIGTVLIPRAELTPNKFVRQYFPLVLSDTLRSASAEHAELLLEIMLIQTDGLETSFHLYRCCR